MTEEQRSHPESPEETLTIPLQGLPSKKSEDFSVIYANSVHVVVSPWDCSLVFGQTVAEDVKSLYLEQRVSLTLSMQTAKALADILVKNVRDYEQKYGPVRYRPLPGQAEEPSA